MRHAGREEPEDHVRHAVPADERLEVPHDPVRCPDQEPVHGEPIEVGRRRRVDERMLPGPPVLLAVGEHEMPVGKLARLPLRLGEAELPRHRPLGRLRKPGAPTVLPDLGLALEEPPEVRRRAWQPRVREQRRPAERDVAPAADPERRVRPLDGLGLDPTVQHREVLAPMRDAVPRPQCLHEGEPLLEARAALLEGRVVEEELVGLVADRDAQHRAPGRHDVEEGRLLGEPHRVVEREHADVRAQRESRRPRGERRQHLDRGGPVVVAHAVVLGKPDRVETEGLGAFDLGERLPEEVAALGGADPELEPGHLISCCKVRPGPRISSGGRPGLGRDR